MGIGSRQRSPSPATPGDPDGPCNAFSGDGKLLTRSLAQRSALVGCAMAARELTRSSSKDARAPTRIYPIGGREDAGGGSCRLRGSSGGCDLSKRAAVFPD